VKKDIIMADSPALCTINGHTETAMALIDRADTGAKMLMAHLCTVHVCIHTEVAIAPSERGQMWTARTRMGHPALCM
jgi:hypothetical protein